MTTTGPGTTPGPGRRTDERAAEPDGGWSRLHPLTPLLRSGRLVSVLAVVVLPRLLTELDRGPSLLILLGVLAVGSVYGVLAWRATRYGLVDGVLRLDTGVLLRRTRRVPLDRLQAVDVVRGVAARVFGLAELRLEVVGGSSSEAPFAYLAEADAQDLRRRLLAASRGTTAPTGDGAAQETDADEQPLLAVPLGTLTGSLLLGPSVLVLALVLGVGLIALLDLQAAVPVLAVLLPGLLAAGSAVVNGLLSSYGFRLSRSGDDLRIRRGLLATRSQTVPPDRVQALRIQQPLLWRPFGWVRVEVEVAGYSGGGQEGRASATLLPVAPRATAAWLCGLLLSAARGPDGVPRLADPALVGVPRRARWRAPVQAGVLGVGLDADCVLLRRGRLRPVLDVVPVEKIQSVRTVQGPWQRRLRLAELHVDTVGGRFAAVGPHRDAREADELLRVLVDRAAAARASRETPRSETITR